MVTLSGNLNFQEGGFFFTDIYYGSTPELTTLTVLSGGNNDFSSIEFQTGASFSGGSIIIGSHSANGVVQVFDMNTRTVIDVHTTPELESDNIEDFS